MSISLPRGHSASQTRTPRGNAVCQRPHLLHRRLGQGTVCLYHEGHQLMMMMFAIAQQDPA